MKNNEKGIWISTAIAASAVAAVAAVGYATTSLLVKPHSTGRSRR